jgi:hypothetical protein
VALLFLGCAEQDLKCSNSNFYQIKNSAKQTCSQLLDSFAIIGYTGAWGKLIHEKNLKSKISWQCPFNFLLHVKICKK